VPAVSNGFGRRGGDRGAAFIHRYNTRTYDDSPLVSSVRRHRRKCVYGMRKHSFVLARSIRTVADETTTARTVFNYRSSGCFSFDYAIGPWRARVSSAHFGCAFPMQGVFPFTDARPRRGLFHRYGFGEAAGLIAVAARVPGVLIGQSLPRQAEQRRH